MWKLRVKIDSWSKGIDEDIRERNRGLVEEAYRRLPPRRYILYYKFCRDIITGQPDTERVGDMSGPEDAVAKGTYQDMVSSGLVVIKHS